MRKLGYVRTIADLRWPVLPQLRNYLQGSNIWFSIIRYSIYKANYSRIWYSIQIRVSKICTPLQKKNFDSECVLWGPYAHVGIQWDHSNSRVNSFVRKCLWHFLPRKNHDIRSYHFLPHIFLSSEPQNTNSSFPVLLLMTRHSIDALGYVCYISAFFIKWQPSSWMDQTASLRGIQIYRSFKGAGCQ